MASRWPASEADLVAEQGRLATLRPPVAGRDVRLVGGCFACFGRGGSGPGAAGDPGWAGAAAIAGRRLVEAVAVAGPAGAAYRPGLLAMREGPLLEAAVRRLATRPDVLLVNATGRDHPRRAGLAVQLGAVLELPTVGVTHRPLVATGDWPEDVAGAAAPLFIEGEAVGWWLRTRAGARPVAVHAGWATDVDLALEVVRSTGGRVRTPEPIRLARRTARAARAADLSGAGRS